ncbi:RNase HII [Aliiruegeria haliotis]|uniref:Ribonuclease HII n=1 Tax=Aliiruegeria haliotis TaxID=1280846 RepID=A0A2T0RHP0_9RHOB|nr:ribonuclease HII [Aliiruegeria haliotis]PRY20651.1 RNase HII [Aliiruegeria haliotis]
MQPDLSFEIAAWERGARCVAGTDEVGRGPLAGPVTAAAVILDPDNIPDGLNDSKKLTPARREALAARLIDCARCTVVHATVEQIDQMNILRASHWAMAQALRDLCVSPTLAPDHVLVDGNRMPAELPCPGECVVKGDAKSLSIAAASIVAKVARDRIMVDLAQQHPGYGWDRNAGYPTPEHREALRNLGVTPHHRRSFAPVRNILYQENSSTL